MTAGIVLVEDDELVREAVGLMVESLGLTCTSYPNAEALLAIARPDNRPDALLTDVNLGPGMSGFELGDRIKRVWPEIPVIYASGWHSTLADHRLTAGEYLLQKPFGFRALGNILGRELCARI